MIGVKTLRDRFPDLYALPRDRFAALVPAAVKLGIKRGDFHDFSNIDLLPIEQADPQPITPLICEEE